MAPTAHLTFRIPPPLPDTLKPDNIPSVPPPIVDVTDILSLLPQGGVRVGVREVPIPSGTVVHRSFTTPEGTAIWWSGSLEGQSRGIWTCVLIAGLEGDAMAIQRVLMGLPPIEPIIVGGQAGGRLNGGSVGKSSFRNSVVVVDDDTGEIRGFAQLPSPHATVAATSIASKLPFPGAPSPTPSLISRDLPPLPTEKDVIPVPSPPSTPPAAARSLLKPTPPPSPGALLARQVDLIAHNLSPEVPVSTGMSVYDWEKVERSTGDDYGDPNATRPNLQPNDQDKTGTWDGIDDLSPKVPADEHVKKGRLQRLKQLDDIMGNFVQVDFAVVPPTPIPAVIAPATPPSPPPSAETPLQLPTEGKRSSFASVNTMTTSNDVFETASEGGSDSSSETATIADKPDPLHATPTPTPAPSRPLSTFEQLARSHSHPLSPSSVADDNAVLLSFLNSSTFTVQAVTAKQIQERGLIPMAEENGTWWDYFGLSKVSAVWSWLWGAFPSTDASKVSNATKPSSPTSYDTLISPFSTFSNNPLSNSLASIHVYNPPISTRRMPPRSAAGETSARISVLYYDETGMGKKAYVERAAGGR